MITEISTEPATTSSLIAAERGIAELQRGRAIALYDASQSDSDVQSPYQIIQLLETVDKTDLEVLMATHACQLVLSRPRALALGLLVDSSAVCLELKPHTPVNTIHDWAGLNPGVIADRQNHASTRLGGIAADSADKPVFEKRRFAATIQHAKAALNLAHHAHALPAFITYAVAEKTADMLEVSTQSALAYHDRGGELIMLSQARIPLAFAPSVELTVFRERHGNAEHVAITVGEPDFSNTVTVRLHSSCFTGDILGSMKCDCGEQLQGAITSMGQEDGGVVLYVSQEGRGIGLASKLLAYQLQDQGLDTIDANHHLGFDADERRYSAAACMMEKLGINTIRLMTNNPLKIESLREHGVHVESRVPSPATVNVHNARYLETKRERAGHLANCDSAG